MMKSSTVSAAAYAAGYTDLDHPSSGPQQHDHDYPDDEEMNSLVANPVATNGVFELQNSKKTNRINNNNKRATAASPPRCSWSFLAVSFIALVAFTIFACRVTEKGMSSGVDPSNGGDDDAVQEKKEDYVPLNHQSTNNNNNNNAGATATTATTIGEDENQEKNPNDTGSSSSSSSSSTVDEETKTTSAEDAKTQSEAQDQGDKDEDDEDENENGAEIPTGQVDEEDEDDADEKETPAAAATESATDTATVSEDKSHTSTSTTTTSTTTHVPNEAVGFKKPLQYYSDVYLPRARSSFNASNGKAQQEQKLAKEWGSWTLVDPKASTRPGDELYAKYPHRDVPRSDFPSTAWQVDTDYLSKFVPEAELLVTRALEAILAEYGYSHKDMPDKSEEERTKMFAVDLLDGGPGAKWPKDINDNAGYSNSASMEGLKKRLLHSIMAEDTFTVCMGGHSAAAGHGNHFQQSYTLQVGRILEPVMARLGVYGSARNFGMGGLGTLQNAMAAGDIYGSDCDMLLWDSGMTEKGNEIVDVFARQGMLASQRIPFLIGTSLFKDYHDRANVDAGNFGLSWKAGNAGIVLSESFEQVEKLPWAMQYLECTPEFRGACNTNKFMGVCWIPRDDGVEPVAKQLAVPGGRAGWHPGNRRHQLTARLITYPILKALQEALQMWKAIDGYALPDEAWHVTEMYNAQRASVQNMTDMHCFRGPIPKAFCQYPVKGRTEFTPRHNPVGTSIRSIVKASDSVLEPKPNIYDPPDVYNENLDPPEGAVDVLAILENGVAFAPNLGRKNAIRKRQEEEHKRDLREARRQRQRQLGTAASVNSNIVPGKGWWIDSVSAPDTCDGTYDSFCNRGDTNDCLLYGHNDHRGGLLFDSYSGWLILNLEDLQHGMIEIKMETWHRPNENPATADWCSENNETPCRREHVRALTDSDSTSLSQVASTGKARSLGEVCDAFQFDIAIDGKIQTWDKATFEAKQKVLQRVVETWTLLDDETYTAGKAKDVELAIRMRGCKRDATFQLTHVYWA